MKKKLLISLFLIVITSFYSISSAKNVANSDLTEAIKLYKAGNYSQSYVKLDSAINKDPSNPLGYYYKAMTAAQIGKKSEAIENYEKTLALSPNRSNLIKYAEKGKRCLENPDKCNESPYEDAYDQFIRGKVPSGFSDEARGMFEKLKIEQMMRDMNRQEDINPKRFKEYRDFSSMNNEPSVSPTNDEIVAAVRTLQNAGLLNFGINNYSDLSLITGSNNTLGNIKDFADMNPQLMQTMLTNGMSLGF